MIDFITMMIKNAFFLFVICTSLYMTWQFTMEIIEAWRDFHEWRKDQQRIKGQIKML